MLYVFGNFEQLYILQAIFDKYFRSLNLADVTAGDRCVILRHAYCVLGELGLSLTSVYELETGVTRVSES